MGAAGQASSTIERRRFLLLVPALIALLAALAAGLVRLGWNLPLWQTPLPGAHGPLMISSFLGTLMGVERAVALGRRWGWTGPVLTGAGGLLLLIGAEIPGQVLITVGSLALIAVFFSLYRLQPALHTVVMGFGAGCWLAGNLFWLAGWPIFKLVLWWLGFLVLTICGERLELSRLMKPAPGSRVMMLGAVGLLVAGMSLAPLFPDAGTRVAGAGLLAFSLWLLRFDVARRTVRQSGLTRFVAICLLAGYFWLGAAGLLAIAQGAFVPGPSYDTFLHAVALGFAFSMILGHAPIIFPAVLRVRIPFHPSFYAPLALLHASLLMRAVGDVLSWWPGRLWGGLLNEVAVLLFLANTARVAIRAMRRPPLRLQSG